MFFSDINSNSQGGGGVAAFFRNIASLFALRITCFRLNECTDKKENRIFYVTNGLLIYGEIFAHFLILGSPSSYMTLQLLHS